jgi:hypothetical protein
VAWKPPRFINWRNCDSALDEEVSLSWQAAGISSGFQMTPSFSALVDKGQVSALNNTVWIRYSMQAALMCFVSDEIELMD